MRNVVDQVTGVIRGRLVVGMVVGCRVTALFDALAAFHRVHPGIDLVLIEDSSDRLVDAVNTGEADLALVAGAGSLSGSAGLDGFRVLSERLAVGVPADHPLAHRKRLRLADLTGHAVVCLPLGTGIRTVFEHACAAKGVGLDLVLEASAPDSVVDLAARGLGVAVLAKSMLAGHGGRVLALPLVDVRTPVVLQVVWGRRPSPAMDELVRHAREAFRGDARVPQLVAPGPNRRFGDGP
jgi:DNA-binding transcriptional LysR family regulator